MKAASRFAALELVAVVSLVASPLVEGTDRSEPYGLERADFRQVWVFPPTVVEQMFRRGELLKALSAGGLGLLSCFISLSNLLIDKIVRLRGSISEVRMRCFVVFVLFGQSSKLNTADFALRRCSRYSVPQ